MPNVEDMTTATMPATAAAGTAPRRSIVHQLLVDSRYVLLGFPLAIAGFVVVITGLSLGAGLAVTVLGLPVLTGTLYAARIFADIERARMPAVLRRPRVRPHYRSPRPGAGFWRRVFVPIADVQSWLDVVHGIVRFAVAVATFSVAVTWWAMAAAGSLFWAYDWALPRDPDNYELHELLGLADTPGNRIAFYSAIGVFFLLTLPIVVRGCALLQAGLGRALLSGIGQLQQRITVLEEQKRAAVSAEAAALRRLERDIHDGPQQRLVRLAMDLGRAQQQLDSNPEAARRTIDEALAQTRETLDELRALSRGIAPPILVDRGLPSALTALAGRCTVPVELAVDPALGTSEGRLDAAVESAGYFIVAEALTNVAKHSRAGTCWLTVVHSGRLLGISVIDDGIGGAHVAKGHGLAGLADRVHAAGGTLTVASPPGGPTEVRAELPA
jgi:signal transduction histidine kinase